MRIERLTATLYAVLAAVLTAAQSHGSQESKLYPTRFRHSPNSHLHKNMEDETLWKRDMWQQTRNTLKRESDFTSSSECCPTEEELTAPLGGTNSNGLFVELFRDVNTTQIFYEYSCKKGVENQPCRFVDYRLHNISTCVQQFSWAYALVRDVSKGTESPHQRHKRKLTMTPSNIAEGGWMMDHIQIRNGCSCQVSTSSFKKHKKLFNENRSFEKLRHHKEQKLRRDSKNDET